MPDKQSETLWEDASDADRAAVMEIWWVKAIPAPGSDEHLILQMMSGPSMAHGDPEAAKEQLFERGLLERSGEHRSNLTDSGREVFYKLYDKVYRE